MPIIRAGNTDNNKYENNRVLDLTNLINTKKLPESSYFVCDLCRSSTGYDIKLLEFASHDINPHIAPGEKQYICPSCGVIKDTGAPPDSIKRSESFKTFSKKKKNQEANRPFVQCANLLDEQDQKQDEYSKLDFNPSEDENMINSGLTNVESTIRSAVRGTTYSKRFP